MNRELRLIEPWLVAGTTAGLATCSDPDLQVVAMQRGRLNLVAIRRAPNAAPRDEAVQPQAVHSITVPGVPDGARAYVLAPGGTRLLPHNRVAGGTRVLLQDVPPGAYLVLTDDVRALTAISRSAAQGAERAVHLMRFLAIEELRQAEQIANELGQQPAAQQAAQRAVAAAKTAVGHANLALASGDHERAYRHILAARADLAALESQLIEQPANTPSSVSSPLAGSFPLLMDEWKLLWALAALPRGDNLLHGGDCEALDAMRAHGWTHTRYPIDGIQSAVELTTDAPQQGSRALRLLASPTSLGVSAA
ncbi:MAG: hypothetical protein ACRD6I_20715, partial [Candidatus Acidiferrales bacterium]